MTPEIIAIGEPLMEFNALKEGGLEENMLFQKGYGGDTSNFAVAAARAGARVAYVTMVGEDPFGRSLLDLWRREGIGTDWVRTSAHSPTGVYFITRDKDHHHFTYFRKGSAASMMTPEILPEKAISQAKVLHLSGISQAISPSARKTCTRALQLARETGVLISYDPNLRTRLWPLEKARKVIHDTVRHVDFFMPSLEDARTLTGLSAPEKIIDFYRTLGAGTLVLKCGIDGAVLADADGVRQFCPVPVVQVDASGAGDAFCGAFMAEYLRGSPLDTCVRFAAAAAALSVRKMGCIDAIPSRNDILAILADSPLPAKENPLN